MFVAIKYTNREVKYNSKLAGKHSLLMTGAISEGSLFYKCVEQEHWSSKFQKFLGVY